MPSLKTRLLHALSEQQAASARVAALEASVGDIETNIGDADIGAVVVTVDGFVIDLSNLADRVSALETP